MKPTHREEAVYAAVKMGLLDVRKDGSVWRVKYRRRNRWNSKTTITEANPPHRIDSSAGIGYRQVKVMMDGKQVGCLAHRLVWLHHHGPIPANMQINHINGDKADNRPSNLELTDASGNQSHAHRAGLSNQKGTKNNYSRFNPMEIEAIRTEYAQGRANQAEIAKRHKVSHQAISKIVRGDRMVSEPGATADYTRNRQSRSPKRNSKGQFHS